MKFFEKSIQLGESMVKYTKKVDEKISSLKKAVFHKIKLLKSLKWTNDHLEIGNLERNFDLGVTIWCNSRY